ncbi:hypothetical protein MLD38_004291 [Melastoma candidum]|uniref:Uncharacterized protein n=1 Tax=Melastoma candidum TaxID=119954 RepID=A0ACB9S5D5_9MYRT|nr:hypothetical protein MLD38_004291 [Melastoma candidum]
MSPRPLLGPPELYKPDPMSDPEPASGDPFSDQLTANFNNLRFSNNYPSQGQTEKGAATYLSSGNPCLDFFFHVLPRTPPNSLTARLAASWAHDPDTALKLVCNLRGVRGTGKSDREGFYESAYWLFANHPRTLACNVEQFAGFGYFKDLPEILYRLVEGSDARRKQRAEWSRRKNSGSRCRKGREYPMRHLVPRKRKARNSRSAVPREIRVVNAEVRSQEEKLKARELRQEKRISMAKKLVEKYNSDGNFQLLYDSVAEFFAKCLRADAEFLTYGETRKISLAAKWCPSVDSSFDRSLLLCEAIARKALKLPEVYIGANRWDLIPYQRVASVAMTSYKEKFFKHDTARFRRYLKNIMPGEAKIAKRGSAAPIAAGPLLPSEIIVSSGDNDKITRSGSAAPIAAGSLLPHEIIASLGDDDGGIVAELQWKKMVSELTSEGKLENCIAVCDLSESMVGIPMEASVAMGILVSELSQEPWQGKLITFSEKPELHLIKGESLREKAEFVKKMEWGRAANFQKVFDRILCMCVKGKLKPEEMVRTVFVFSDMEFDEASPNPWETDYQMIKRKYEEHGYGGCVPRMVFWNLRESQSTPVICMQKWAVLVSGYSKNMLKLFLRGGAGAIGENPEEVMTYAISGPEYQKLQVMD